MHPETEAVLQHLTGRVVEIGGGGNPTPGVRLSIDHTPRGSKGTAGSQAGVESAAGVCADMRHLPLRSNSFDTLVARHTLEHHYDTLGVLREWCRVAPKLVVIVPDQGAYPGNTVHLDPTHTAAFTRGQLVMLAEHAGYDRLEQVREAVPEWSFLLVARRTV